MFTEADRALARERVFHRRAAIAAGLSERQIRHRLETHMWIEVMPRVYRHTATTPDLSMMRSAAILWAGDGATLSHRSAGAMWQLETIEENIPELTVRPDRNPRSALVVVHRSNIRDDDVTQRFGLPVTNLVRTVVDLSSIVPEEQLECALESARRRHGLSLDALGHRLGGAALGIEGAASLRRVIGALTASTACESVLEVKVARRLRHAALPAPVRQHWVRLFGRRYRLDFAWPDLLIALECDGRAFHEFERDRTRARRLSAAGWRVIPVTWNDVRNRWPSVEIELASAFSERNPTSDVG